MLLISTSVWGKTLDLREAPVESLLQLNGAVTGRTVLPLVIALDRISTAKERIKEVHILINSPGGEVITGYILINSMELAKARGVRVNCVVASHAFSMAMMILPYCSKVYALPNALLLFHSIRISTSDPITDEVLKRFKRRMDLLARPLEVALQRIMDISMEEYVILRDSEMFFPASEFHAKYPRLLTLVDNVELPANIKLFGDFQ